MQWPNGPVCPHCGNVDSERITAMQGKAHRPGLYNCMECRQQFSVTAGTVFVHSKIAPNKWLLATFLMASSKKGISAKQLERMFGVTYKTAWFMAHRIREAMKEDVTSSSPIGGPGMTVEADETYIGKREDQSPSLHRKGRPIHITADGYEDYYIEAWCFLRKTIRTFRSSRIFYCKNLVTNRPINNLGTYLMLNCF